MRLRQIRYFIEIIKSQSYSVAAKNLYVTQPTLSWNMNELQEELNTKLLYQAGNVILPTTTGIFLYENGKKMLQDSEYIIQEIANTNNDTQTSLTVGSNAVISPFFLTLIKKFMDTYPHIGITVEEDGSVKTQKKIAKGELEIGMVSFPIKEDSLSIQKNIHHNFKYHTHVIMNPKNPLAQQETVSFEDLATETFISMSKDFVLWDVLHEKAKESGFVPQVQFTSNNYEVLIKSVMNSDLVALLPIELRQAHSDKVVCWKPLDSNLKPFDIVVAYQRDKHLTPAAALFLEYVTTNKLT